MVGRETSRLECVDNRIEKSMMNDSFVSGQGAAIRESQAARKPSICFVALNAYNLLSGREDLNHIGGAEVQQVRIAKWLKEKGYRVSFVTLDHGQPDGMDCDGIKVFKAYRKKEGIPGLRFVHPRWSGLWAAMARADAGVYYHRCAEAETGQVALWCRIHGRKFVSASAHDSDCDLKLLREKHARIERVLYLLGVRLADGITVQTKKQQDLFQRSMKRDTTLVRNCCWSVPEGVRPDVTSASDRLNARALWVGRISSTSKRFEWLLDVAERCPDITFDVVGAASGNSDCMVAMVERGEQLSNVNMCGAVPYAEMAAYYRRCNILCCTSEYEGFPNTFLEAWRMGIPVVTTFDPDGIVAANGLGWVAKSIDEVEVYLKRALNSPKILAEASEAAKRYCVENFVADVCLPPLERLFMKLAATEQVCG